MGYASVIELVRGLNAKRKGLNPDVFDGKWYNKVRRDERKRCV